MALPFFYRTGVAAAGDALVLDEDTSKHVVQVLRMQNEELLQLTNGGGLLLTARVTDNNRKRCAVMVTEAQQVPRAPQQISIAISLTKNSSRFEWFLEKATELGVTEIIPLLCARTEKQHFRQERMQGVLVSAMLQSQQAWLPQLTTPVKFEQFVNAGYNGQKYIAHCLENEKQPLHQQVSASAGRLILIGPEGDFTPAEIEQACSAGFMPVSLGSTRLRTETAGMTAAVLLAIVPQ